MKAWIAAFAGVLLALSAHGQLDDVIATVLGEEITVEDALGSDIAGLIAGPLIEKFAEDNDIRPTEEDLVAFAEGMLGMQREQLSNLEDERARLERRLEGASTANEREEIQGQLDLIAKTIDSLSESQEFMNIDLVRPVATRWVRSWKVNRALYEKYGGRVIFQQAGFEPFDAQREFLEEQQANGAFEILDADYVEEFWRYWRKDPHGVVGEEQAREMMSKPWWLMERPTGQ